MDFMENLRNTLESENNFQRTENNALGYKTTGRTLLDMNFRIPSYRENTIKALDDFKQAFWEDPELTLKWLFYARDVRGGLGERDLFINLFSDLVEKRGINQKTVDYLLPLISEYGRWGDVVRLLGISENIDQKLIALFGKQLKEDMANVRYNENAGPEDKKLPVSLLAKWLPSVNTSSKQSRKNARIIYGYINGGIGIKERQYRKMLSKLRAYLDVVEVKMSDRCWGDIDYSRVPSKANILYNKAFFKHDPARREEFVTKAAKGEVKINSSVAYPYEIIHSLMKIVLERGYIVAYRKANMNPEIEALEAMWKQLPDYQLENTIVVADESGSMTNNIPKSSVTALEVANSLAIYFAERLKGEYNNKYITFSSRPQFVDLSEGKNLYDKICIALHHSEVANTDIKAVFELILKTAIKITARQEDIPANILIISDMEFDEGASWESPLFKEIERQYIEHGYKLPKIIFWNVNGRTNTIPMKENENGFALVSGFSLNVFKLITSGKLDPMEALIDVLMSERYSPVKLIKEGE
jgi:hypothetical protein